MRRSRALAVAAGLGFTLVGASMASAVTKWRVQDGHWNDPASWDSGIPASDDNAYFTNTADGDSIVTLDAGYADYAPAVAGGVEVQDGKTVRIEMGAGTQLNAAIFIVGSSADPGGNHVTLAGPDSGSATATFSRLYGNDGTPVSSSMVLTGHVDVSLTDSWSGVGYGNTLDITHGASVAATTDAAGKYYIRYDPASRMTIDDGASLSGSFISVSNSTNATHPTAGGLLQLGATGHLSAGNSDTNTLEMTIYSAGRFEAQGSGMDSTVVPTFRSGSTLAVGVTPVGGSRASAAELTLNSTATFNNGSILEMSLFGNGDNDQIHLDASGAMGNGTGSGTILKLLTPTGYTPHPNDSWTLFTGLTSKISGNFDLSQINSAIYNTENFNQAGGWVISVVPEPASVGLLFLGGIGALGVRRRRK